MEEQEKKKWEQWFEEHVVVSQEAYDASYAEDPWLEPSLPKEKFLEAIELAKEETRNSLQPLIDNFNVIAGKLMALPDEERLRILGSASLFPEELEIEHPKT